MFEKLKQNWGRFRKRPAGKRFQEHYHSRCQIRRSPLKKILLVGSGTLIIAIGIFFLAVPGPGMLVILIGAGLIAEESLFISRILDWLELRLRKLAAWSIKVWQRSPPGLKTFWIIMGLGIMIAAGILTYKTLFAE